MGALEQEAPFLAGIPALDEVMGARVSGGRMQQWRVGGLFSWLLATGMAGSWLKLGATKFKLPGRGGCGGSGQGGEGSKL